MSGSKFSVREQGRAAGATATRTVFIVTPTTHGPQDEQLEIAGMARVEHDANGDFLPDPQAEPEAFDAVHTFAVARQVLTMHQRALRRMELEGDFPWQWGRERLRVHPRAGVEGDAAYAREARALSFFSSRSEALPGNPLVHSCRSCDLVAHQMGHAVLDALCPGYWFDTSWRIQTRALHEAFADLSAVFAALSQVGQCAAIIAECRADPRAKGFLAALGERFEQPGLDLALGLRNAANDLTLSAAGNAVQALSQVFTGAVYDVVARLFEHHWDRARHDPVQTLWRVGEHVNALLIGAIATAPTRNATFTDIARRMRELETKPHARQIILEAFLAREIAPSGPPLVASNDAQQGPDRSLADTLRGCCGTVLAPRHVEQAERCLARALQRGRGQ